MLFPQLIFELVIVADNSIMHHSNATSVIKVRMRIHICLVTVGGPPCVPNSYIVVVLRSTLDTDSLDAVASESV